MKFIRQLLGACALLGVMGGALAADAPKTAKDLFLRDDARCTTCHDESDAPGILHLARTKHGTRADGRTPTCTSCHGDSAEHVNYKGSAKPPKPERWFGKSSTVSAQAKNEACQSCHEKDPKRHQWAGSAHDTQDFACTSCHQMHTQKDRVMNKITQSEVCYSCHKEQRAQSHRISTHPIASGKVACSDCHNSHGSAGPKMLKKNTLNETCFTCHAEKRGPYLWEHQPVAEDCSSCHTPHGSSITPLLKSRSPFLCQECHDGPHNSKVPYGRGTAGYQAGLSATNVPPTENAAGRGCQTCHSMVHGSNHPAGALLHR